MTENNRPVTEDDLHAYADAQLSNGNLARVEAWLKSHPDDLEKVRAWQAQNCLIQTLFEPYQRSMPGDAAMLSQRQGAPDTKPFSRWGMAAAAGGLFIAGALAGQLVSIPDAGKHAADSEIAAEARSSFNIYTSEVRHPVEVTASDKDHLMAWLGKRVGTKMSAPDLSALGFNLVGGRVVPVNEKAGALLMYEDKTGKRITVTVGRSEQPTTTSFRIAAYGPIQTFYWIDDDLSYAVTGEVPRELMQQIAESCYKQWEQT